MKRALRILRDHHSITANRDEDPELVSLLYFLEHHGFVTTETNEPLVTATLEFHRRKGFNVDRVLDLYTTENMGGAIVSLSSPSRVSPSALFEIRSEDLPKIPGAFHGCGLSLPDGLEPMPHGREVTRKRVEEGRKSSYFLYVSPEEFYVKIVQKGTAIAAVHSVPTIASMLGGRS